MITNKCYCFGLRALDFNLNLKNSLDQMFKDVTQSDYQLICSSPLAHRLIKSLTLSYHEITRYIAMGLIVRGGVTFSDVNR